MAFVEGIIGWVQGMIEKLFGFFGFYTENYSRYLVYALLLVAGAKIFKIKLDIKTGK